MQASVYFPSQSGRNGRDQVGPGIRGISRQLRDSCASFKFGKIRKNLSNLVIAKTSLNLGLMLLSRNCPCRALTLLFDDDEGAQGGGGEVIDVGEGDDEAGAFFFFDDFREAFADFGNDWLRRVFFVC